MSGRGVGSVAAPSWSSASRALWIGQWRMPPPRCTVIGPDYSCLAPAPALVRVLPSERLVRQIREHGGFGCEPVAPESSRPDPPCASQEAEV